jgi:NADPH:quinone reductase-like Zn-dependent oxidoreductase
MISLMIQSMMKAIALDRFGGIEAMKLQMLPVPEAGPDEVLIHFEWAGVGQWDPFGREGRFARLFGIEPKFPYVFGSDGAGTVAGRVFSRGVGEPISKVTGCAGRTYCAGIRWHETPGVKPGPPHSCEISIRCDR